MHAPRASQLEKTMKVMATPITHNMNNAQPASAPDAAEAPRSADSFELIAGNPGSSSNPALELPAAGTSTSAAAKGSPELISQIFGSADPKVVEAVTKAFEGMTPEQIAELTTDGAKLFAKVREIAAPYIEYEVNRNLANGDANGVLVEYPSTKVLHGDLSAHAKGTVRRGGHIGVSPSGESGLAMNGRITVDARVDAKYDVWWLPTIRMGFDIHGGVNLKTDIQFTTDSNGRPQSKTKASFDWSPEPRLKTNVGPAKISYGMGGHLHDPIQGKLNELAADVDNKYFPELVSKAEAYIAKMMG